MWIEGIAYLRLTYLTKSYLMAFSTTISQSPVKPSVEKPVDNGTAALFSMLLLSLYAGKMTKKAYRKMKRQLLWTAFKLKVKSLFSKKKALTDRQLILYIAIGVVALILVFYAPIAALILALVALILILTGTI